MQQTHPQVLDILMLQMMRFYNERKPEAGVAVVLIGLLTDIPKALAVTSAKRGTERRLQLAAQVGCHASSQQGNFAHCNCC